MVRWFFFTLEMFSSSLMSGCRICAFLYQIRIQQIEILQVPNLGEVILRFLNYRGEIRIDNCDLYFWDEVLGAPAGFKTLWEACGIHFHQYWYL